MDTPKVGQFCWNELATNDVQKAKDFYGKLFGWKFIDNNMGDMTYTMITLDGKDKSFAGIWEIPNDKEKQIPPHWMSYVLVEDLDKSIEKAKASGATIMKPATAVGEMGRLAIIKDPTGAHLAFWQTLQKK